MKSSMHEVIFTHAHKRHPTQRMPNTPEFHMKNTILKFPKIYLRAAIVGLVGFTVAPTVFADGVNFGLDFGRSKAQKYCYNITNCQSRDTGPKIDVGYEFNENWSMELGYTSFGTIFDSKDNGFTASQDSRAVTLTGLGTLPLTEAFSIYGRLGYARYDSNASGTVQGVPVKDIHGNTPVWGVGAKYDLTKAFAVRVEFQNYANISRVDGRKDDVQGLYAGIVYRL